MRVRVRTLVFAFITYRVQNLSDDSHFVADRKAHTLESLTFAHDLALQKNN